MSALTFLLQTLAALAPRAAAPLAVWGVGGKAGGREAVKRSTAG
ncbi:hypothetical protein [Azospirillum soli]|nr:hypothetical protein [Azospirillum soli]MBP2311338.1 hypothetical protein [Azospirillum soli]